MFYVFIKHNFKFKEKKLNMRFYSREQLEKIEFKSLGKNVLISDKTSIYSPENISIGNNLRIDDLSILNAGMGH